jgi:hypothetical protein
VIGSRKNLITEEEGDARYNASCKQNWPDELSDRDTTRAECGDLTVIR